MKKIMLFLILLVLVTVNSCTKKPDPQPTPTQEATPSPTAAQYDPKIEDLLFASQRGDNIAIKEILYFKPQLLNMKGRKEPNQGYAALHLASADNKIGAMNFLIEKGATINITDQTKRTPLHYAADRGHMEATELLIKNKADVNAVDALGLTPLHMAAIRENLPVMKKLIEHKADVNARDRRGQTPLHWTAIQGKIKAAQLLIDKEADINMPNINSVTAMDLAISRNQQAFADFLKKNGGVTRAEIVKSRETNREAALREMRERRIKFLARKELRATITDEEKKELKDLIEGKPLDLEALKRSQSRQPGDGSSQGRPPGDGSSQGRNNQPADNQ